MSFKKSISSSFIYFDDIRIKSKKDWEGKYLETHYCRIKKTLETMRSVSGNKVLEIGCDSGLFSLIFKKTFKNIEHLAVEVDQEKIDVAVSRNINVVKVNVETEKLPFDNDYFDIVLFTEVIEHLSNPLFVLSEIRRVTKQNGNVIISTPNAVGLFSRYNHLFGSTPYYVPFLKNKDSKKGKYSAHRFELTLGQMKRLLEENNYKIENIIFTRFNHQQRGIIPKIIERLSLLKKSWSDIMIFKCKIVK